MMAQIATRDGGHWGLRRPTFERVRQMLSAEGFYRPRKARADLFRRIGTYNWQEEKALREKWYPERQIMPWDRTGDEASPS